MLRICQKGTQPEKETGKDQLTYQNQAKHTGCARNFGRCQAAQKPPNTGNTCKGQIARMEGGALLRPKIIETTLLLASVIFLQEVYWSFLYSFSKGGGGHTHCTESSSGGSSAHHTAPPRRGTQSSHRPRTYFHRPRQAFCGTKDALGCPMFVFQVPYQQILLLHAPRISKVRVPPA